MSSIASANLSNLTNDAFRTLFVRIHQETHELADTKRKAAFCAAWTAFEQAMDDSTRWRRSLKDYDADCDKAWSLLSAQLNASKMHFDANRANAAAKVAEIIDPIGNVTRLAYEKEYALIRKALNQLAELDAEVLKTAHIDDIVTHLRECYDMFMAAQQDENVQRASYQNGVVKDARSALAAAWNQYAALLEVLADDDDKVEDTIKKINQCIAEISVKRASKSTDEAAKEGNV